MPIVPVYRLRAMPSDPYARYRFSRDAHPDPNPTPGEPNPDADSRWAVDRVAFYAWNDTVQDGTLNDALVPVYEFYQLDENRLVRYLYSSDPNPPGDWIPRRYVAFWLYPAGADHAGAPVYLYAQRISEGVNYALAVSPRLPEPWSNESILGSAAGTVPVMVSVRQAAVESAERQDDPRERGDEWRDARERGDEWHESRERGTAWHESRERAGDPVDARERGDRPGVGGVIGEREDASEHGTDREDISALAQRREDMKRHGNDVDDIGDPPYHWTHTPSTINVAYPCTLQFRQAPESSWRFTNLEILDAGEDFDRPIVTDALVLVKARYVNPGRDFKYRLTIDVFEGPDRLVGDPEVINETPERL